MARTGRTTPSHVLLLTRAPGPAAVAATAGATAAATATVTAPSIAVVTASAGAAAAATATLTVKGTAYRDAILAETGLVSYWRLGETSGNALDSQDSNPGTTIAGGVTRNVAGLLNTSTDGAIQLDGNSGSYIRAPFAANMNTGAQMSIEAWAKPSAVAGGVKVVARSNLLTFYLDMTVAPNWRFLANDSVPTAYQAFGGVPTVGQVAHLVGVYDSLTSTIKLYVNGVLVSTVAASANGLRSTSDAFTVGTDSASLSNWFNGVIDEVALYNVALTPAQITNHYALGSGTPFLTASAGATTQATAQVTAPTLLDPTAQFTARAKPTPTLFAPSLITAAAGASAAATVQITAPALLTASAGATAQATAVLTVGAQLTATAGAKAQATSGMQVPGVAFFTATAGATAAAIATTTAPARLTATAGATAQATAAVKVNAAVTATAGARTQALATVFVVQPPVGAQGIHVDISAPTVSVTASGGAAVVTATAGGVRTTVTAGPPVVVVSATGPLVTGG
jgi:hypothetical protein